MMRTLLHILSKTYPFFYGDRKNNVITFIIASVFVLHVMLIMRPDLITRNIQTNYTLAAFAYALITFATSIVWIELLPRFAENWFRHWKVYKELLLTGSCIVAMGFLNYAYIALFGRTDFSFEIKVEDALKIVSLTVFSGLVPLVLITLLNFLRLERVRKESVSLPIRNPVGTQTVAANSLMIEEGNEVFKLEFQAVYAIESMGNYIKIHQVQDRVIRVCMKRVTMKRIENLLQQHQMFIRVHRSYIVNISLVSRVHKGISGDLNLLFPYDKSISVPVSRNKRREMCDLLKFQNVI